MTSEKLTAVIAELRTKSEDAVQHAADAVNLPDADQQTPDEVELHEIEAAHHQGRAAGLMHAVRVLQLASVAQVWIPPEPLDVHPDDFLPITRNELAELLHAWAAVEAVEWMRIANHPQGRADRANIAGRISALISFAELVDTQNLRTPVAGDRLPYAAVNYEELYKRAVALL